MLAIFAKVADTAVKVSHLAAKHSPALLGAAGLVGIGVTTYTSIKAAKKVEQIIEDVENDQAMGLPVDNQQVGVNVIKAVAPAVISGTITVACLVGSYMILNGRLKAVSAAMGVLAEQFTRYRNKVREEYGVEKDLEFIEATKIDEEGHVTQNLETDWMNGVWYSLSDEYVRDNMDYNLIVIKEVDSRLFDLRQRRGFLTVNDMFRELGMPPVAEGNDWGWRTGDGFYLACDPINNTDDEDGWLFKDIFLRYPAPSYIVGIS